jgi:hypothetical protein
VSALSLEKLRIEKARQKMLDQEYRMRAEGLVDAEEVDREMREVEQWLRKRWLAVPAKLAPELVAKFGGDEAKVRQLLEESIREMLDHLPRWEPIAEKVGDSKNVLQERVAADVSDIRCPGGGRKPNSLKKPNGSASRQP